MGGTVVDKIAFFAMQLSPFGALTRYIFRSFSRFILGGYNLIYIVIQDKNQMKFRRFGAACVSQPPSPLKNAENPPV
jgi:hypothetical protein